MRRLFVILLIVLFEFSTFAILKPAIAKADDLIIDDNGSVTLIITGNSTPVLGDSTVKKEENKPATPAPAPKVIPVAPANSNTTVKITPSTTDNKKLNITIETTKTAPVQAPAKNSTPAPTAAPVKQTSSPTSAPVVSSEKTVDNVILRDADKQPVLTVKSDQNTANQINIQQQGVNVSTKLPIQIDSKTHVVSLEAGGTTQQVLILPDQAVRGAEQKLTNSNLTTTKSDVSLVQGNGQAEYVVNQTKTGKLFGIISVALPSQVKISAKTGKTVSVWQSPLSFFSGLFVR